MHLLTCPRCSRVNPAQALFCYNDGVALGDPGRNQAAADPARRRFPMPFVFPSGQAAYSFDELALAIVARWDEARELLRQGMFAGFLAGLGRADLARAAREAAREANRDQALDQLLGRLPARVLTPPRLSVEPAQVNLGTLRPGQDVRFDLHLANEGMGLLHGSISCEGSPGLLVGDPSAHQKKKLFQFLHDAAVAVHVVGKALVASRKRVSATVSVESNGGQVQVPVTFEVPVQPFPEGVLAGAVTPRQVAERARERPREAGELFAGGAVARWYESNGWTYPVKDPAAWGVAAVQQFFEALGVTSPPKVRVSPTELRLEAAPGAVARAEVVVTTQEKKPVFAHATSDQPWLRVEGVDMDGRAATVRLAAQAPPAGRPAEARLTVTSNGRRRFIVPVSLSVRGQPAGSEWYRLAAVEEEAVVKPAPAAGDVVVVDGPPPPSSVRRPPPLPSGGEPVLDAIPAQSQGRRVLFALLPVAFLVLGLTVTLVRDLIAWVQGPAAGQTEFAEEDISRLPALLSIRYHERPEKARRSREGVLVLPRWGGGIRGEDGTWEPSMRFGVSLLGGGKRLTFDADGLTNNTVVRLDGRESIYGETPFRPARPQRGVPFVGPAGGRWLDREARLTRPMRDGRRSVWSFDEEKVEVTQTVGLVPGAQSHRLDTCLVHYRIENKDRAGHRLGLRFMLDTFIGNNDGVPFLVPGSPELCNTSQEFNAPDLVPDFIQARQTEDLAHPGTIALVQLRVPGSEPPSRVTLGAWPNPGLDQSRLCKAAQTLWEVPVHSMKARNLSDSCVVIYWDERELAPGEARVLAFAYGLGSVAADETGGALGLTVAGSFEPKGEFTLTAEVRQPRPGQTLTLTLPAGFERIGGQQTQPVPAAPAGGISPVTWRVRAGPEGGQFTLRVQSNTGLAQSRQVQIRRRVIFGG